jgi:hypothetical protein
MEVGFEVLVAYQELLDRFHRTWPGARGHGMTVRVRILDDNVATYLNEG